MRTLITTGFVTVVSFLPLTATAQEKLIPKPSLSAHVDGSLCMKPDQIIFSCQLEKSGKIVSMCAAENTTPHQFYYAFGRPHAVEMAYPSTENNSAKAFEQAHLFFAGGTGGHVYSFTHQDYKYILYSISGTGFDTAGVLVQHQGELRALSDMKCRSGNIKEADDNLQNSINSSWEHDRNLELHGLPHVPRT